MTRRPGYLWAALALGLLAVDPASAASCRALGFQGIPYTICEADAATDDIRLWLTAPDGLPYGSFKRLNDALGAGGQTLAFAMNGGMYHPDRTPVGLYIEDGRKLTPAQLGGGVGNFGMRPNGVFCVLDGRAEVIETAAYMAAPPGCRFATQSGPMLVIDGALHARFLADGTSRHIRNGVGVAADGHRVVFAISERPVTFFEFATLFRDALGTPNALFLDGNVSKLYAPEFGRADAGRAMGPILGVLAKPPNSGG